MNSNVGIVFFVFMDAQKLGKPLTTRLDERIEEMLREDAKKQKRYLSDLMRILLTDAALRSKRGKP